VANFSRWIFQIVRRECLRLLRPGAIELSEARAEQFLAARSDHELRLEVGLAIQSLPPIYRDVIVLRDLEERTVKEIAKRLSLASETVKTRLRRGRQLMREHLLS
jgi:RNA polymerase sigma factor (sigma-70 family)